MPTFSPALITIMRAVLEEAMTKVPAEQATTVTKAYLAEFILKAAAEGLTSYRGLFSPRPKGKNCGSSNATPKRRQRPARACHTGIKQGRPFEPPLDEGRY
jgi:hypothetical protein